MPFTAPSDEIIQPQGGGFVAPQDEIISSDYWGDVKKNAAEGLKQWPAAGKAMGEQALKIGGGMMPGAAVRSVTDVIGGTPAMQTETGQAAGALYDVGKGAIQGAWQGLKDTGSAAKAPFEMLGGKDLAQTEIGQKFRERPLSVPAGVAGTVGMGLQGLKALRGAGAGADAAEVASVGRTPIADLPEVPSGSKTGDPHALFAYTEKEPLGPGMPLEDKYQIFGDPEHPTIKKYGWSTQMTPEQLDEAGIPIIGKVPPRPSGFAQNPHKFADMPGPETQPPETPGVNTPPSGTASFSSDPLKQVSDYIAKKYGSASAKPGFNENVGRYLKNMSQELGGKDIGIQPRQIQSMGAGFKGLEKAESLIDYAREKGYFDPGLTDLARKERIKDVTATAGQHVDAIRSMGDTRGVPPVAQIREALKSELLQEFGIDAPNEIKKVMEKFEAAPKTFSGLADLATKLNKSKTPLKSMGQHPGPTTEGANIISRINNEGLRQVLNPEEKTLYTDELRNFGAHKKLEQAVAAAGRRSLSARSNQRGLLGRLWQEALDRGGYRIGGNVAHRMGEGLIKNAKQTRTLPQFFEELAHHTDDVLDEAIDTQGMAHGGIVGEMGEHFAAKYGARK